jgi:hypothetical protein
LAWAKTIHSFEGQNAGPTSTGQLNNAVMRISVHLGDRNDGANNPGLAYTALTRTTTLGSAGRNETIPMKCLDSYFYFITDIFPSGIAQLTHKVNGDEYEKSETQAQVGCLFIKEKHYGKSNNKGRSCRGNAMDDNLNIY